MTNPGSSSEPIRGTVSRANPADRLAWAVCWLATLIAGCGTTRTTDTPRSGLEQLLVTDAVDQALASVDFSPFAGQTVYVDEKYVESTDKKYVVGALRRASLQAGARLVDKLEEADLVLEVHTGAVGTDRTEQYLGVPGFKAPTPISIELPDVKLISRTKQIGTAKLSLVVYDAKSRRAVGPGGLAVSRSVDSNWYVLGLGPINRGTVQQEFTELTGRFALANGKQVLLVAHDPGNGPASPGLSAPPGSESPPLVDRSSRMARRDGVDVGAGSARVSPSEVSTGQPPPNIAESRGLASPSTSADEADRDSPGFWRFDFLR
jgi:hypothetical protein